MESKPGEEVYDMKTNEKSSNTSESDKPGSSEIKSESQDISSQNIETEVTSKRSLDSETTDDVEDEIRRKKRKDGEGKESGGRNGNTAGSRFSAGSRSIGTGNNKCPKNANANESKNGNSTKCQERRSPASPKSGNKAGSIDSDGDPEEIRKIGEGVWTPGPKVPPLKIVIPQQNTSTEQEQGTRNGKNGTTRHQALPYVVASSEAGEPNGPSPQPSPPDISSRSDDRKDGIIDDQRGNHHQRVLRSSHRSAPSPSADRSSNSSSPQQRQSPTPELPLPPQTDSVTQASNPDRSQDIGERGPVDQSESIVPQDVNNTPNAVQQQPPSNELHPRKRKMKQSKESQSTTAANVSITATSTTENLDPSAITTEVHPHEQPITNCYQLFLNIRKQIERRRKGLFPVQPKPPQGFKDYLMNRCTYVLAGNATSRMSVSMVPPPQSLQGAMKELFVEQEKERHRLRMQHVIEKEKLVLSVEQEILRVHGRAARALANQSLPFSVCTILKDEEVYNVITPEQEEKDRNARSRYNGRLFLSWLQDVDDKWEKIKESMLQRHRIEAGSLHAVQCMDWEWKMKELGLCEFKAKPVIDDLHVPMVLVSDDFDLLPA